MVKKVLLSVAILFTTVFSSSVGFAKEVIEEKKPDKPQIKEVELGSEKLGKPLGEKLVVEEGAEKLLDPEEKTVDIDDSLSTPKKKKPAAAEAEAENTDASNAKPIAIDSIHSGTINKEGEIRWYAFYNAKPGKLTVFLQTVRSTDVNYDLHLFKLNEQTMKLEEETISSYQAGKNEQVARIAPEGYYYIAVNSVKGFDTANTFALVVKHSTTYDKSEPDDNAWLAQEKDSTTFTNTQTIDNPFDEDWSYFHVLEPKSLSVTLQNQIPGTVYRADILDAAANVLLNLDQNKQYLVTFPKGDYFIRVLSSSGYSDSQPYTLSVKDQSVASSVVISSINSDGGVEGLVDYPQGKKWRIKNNITVHGKAYDANGYPAYNVPITVYVVTRLNNTVYSGTADANGNFSIAVNGIGPAIGQNTHYLYSFIHYYDVIPLVVASGSTKLSSNVDSVYHFAYSLYNRS
ncbi:peptidase [Brevibacillus laterosporus]|uniref:peptidase n=1 Tax=Brevibacillus laterosporus TaxID=1465 RepID=UPI00264B3BC1|nr:peptidase [Brevibacillus laterosporus]MDN9011007.1 peptidase [Brevibacillus laterosporus]MDO0942030.1 peptidase [Brevibacillus laterosporus]